MRWCWTIFSKIRACWAL